MDQREEWNRAKWASRRGLLELDLLLAPFVTEAFLELNAVLRQDYIAGKGGVGLLRTVSDYASAFGDAQSGARVILNGPVRCQSPGESRLALQLRFS